MQSLFKIFLFSWNLNVLLNVLTFHKKKKMEKANFINIYYYY